MCRSISSKRSTTRAQRLDLSKRSTTRAQRLDLSREGASRDDLLVFSFRPFGSSKDFIPKKSSSNILSFSTFFAGAL